MDRIGRDCRNRTAEIGLTTSAFTLGHDEKAPLAFRVPWRIEPCRLPRFVYGSTPAGHCHLWMLPDCKAFLRIGGGTLAFPNASYGFSDRSKRQFQAGRTWGTIWASSAK